jgi:hypothetical protein
VQDSYHVARTMQAGSRLGRVILVITCSEVYRTPAGRVTCHARLNGFSAANHTNRPMQVHPAKRDPGPCVAVSTDEIGSKERHGRSTRPGLELGSRTEFFVIGDVIPGHEDALRQVMAERVNNPNTQRRGPFVRAARLACMVAGVRLHGQASGLHSGQDGRFRRRQCPQTPG